MAVNKSDILAFIPARSGSKSIPLKNLQKIGNLSLVERSIRLALKCFLPSDIVLSSDSHSILSEASQYGITQHLRPPSYSLDDTSTCATIANYLNTNFSSEQYQWILLLEPTSVFCSPGDIDTCIKLMSSSTDINVFSVSKIHHTFHYANQRVVSNNMINFWNPKLRSNIAPKDRKRSAFRFGNISAIRVDSLLSGKSFFEPTASFFEIPFIRSINIDSMEELELARLLFNSWPDLFLL
jgi:CMP-N,N'-diacetyllegionaminic acid synthase